MVDQQRSKAMARRDTNADWEAPTAKWLGYSGGPIPWQPIGREILLRKMYCSNIL